MNRLKWTSSLLVAVACLSSGCGGGGNTTLDQKFVKTWSGIQLFKSTLGTAQDQGSMTMTIGADGRVSGTMTKNSTSETVSYTGSMQSGGAVEFNYAFNGQNPRNVTGALEVNNSGQLVPVGGSLGVTNNAGAVGTLELTLQ